MFFFLKKEHKRGLENVRQTVRQLLLLLQFYSDRSILVIKPENIQWFLAVYNCLISSIHFDSLMDFRYTTVLLGMFALDYLEISFTETVKSTAPAFTVIISKLLLGK